MRTEVLMAEGRQLPAPRPDVVSLPFWTAARDRRLVVQVCRACGFAQYPPDLLCRRCQAKDPPFAEVSGDGTVYSFAVYTRSFSAAFEVPYVLAMITLDDRPSVRMMANIVDTPLDAIRVGSPVRVTFEQRGDWLLPQFHLAEQVAA
jgi:uncharacterized OB-fold protein